MWAGFSQWLQDYRIGDLAGIAGVFISLVGFFVTIWGVLRSKRAAERAEEAAKAATDSIRLFETVVDFTAAISTLEEIKRAHRQGKWDLLPDRYAAIRKVLISLRAARVSLTEPQMVAIQGAIANLNTIEKTVERALVDPSSLKPAKFNAVLSMNIDALTGVLAELKISKTGV